MCTMVDLYRALHLVRSIYIYTGSGVHLCGPRFAFCLLLALLHLSSNDLGTVSASGKASHVDLLAPLCIGAVANDFVGYALHVARFISFKPP